MTDHELMALAIEASERAYCPYSNFPVGAALLCADGTVFTGANVENGVNSLSICAERTALFKAISEGKHDFVRIAVSCPKADLSSPCGACRQVLFEHAPNMNVLMARADGSVLQTTVRDLLPHGFRLRTQAPGTSDSS
ncbi:cytidine deaminase [Candidatus Bipolaricaulota bacterium]|nr:cytidine deaminase [Candidatus Bipolaricaulota bacterium]